MSKSEASKNETSLINLNNSHTEPNDPELVFNLFINRLIGPNKKSSHGNIFRLCFINGRKYTKVIV